MTAEELIKTLRLEPLPWEGGYYRETYRTDASTAIYYLLTPETSSAMHRVALDEVFHFYSGDPVTQLLLRPDGSSEVVTLGAGLSAGQLPQHIVPAHVWQGALIEPGPNGYALMGTTVAPPFEFEVFELGVRGELVDKYPDRADLISRLTSKP